jgi:putative sugar O-methyltransferase
MLEFKKKILKSFNYSNRVYENKFKSYHWEYQNRKKKNLFKIENLENFRNNRLSEGLDDQFYSKKKTKQLFESLLKKHDEGFILKMLDNKNIGNAKMSFLHKDKNYSTNELFHIKYLAKIKNHIKINKNSIVCEIGPGYGSFISKFLKIFNSKIILIDLPEANFINSYFLKTIFPKKNFFLSSDIRNSKIENKDIEKNDIIIICPWDNLPKLKIDFIINSRSMMEMNRETIKSYFSFIHEKLKNFGLFLCINRYYKDTVGYPIELYNYPFDKYWEVVISEKSWNQDHIHFFLLKRTLGKKGNIQNELKKIKMITLEKIKEDQRIIRRMTPDFLYKFYKKVKFSILKR